MPRFLMSMEQIPVLRPSQITMDPNIFRAIVFFACEFMYSEEAFVDEVLEHIAGDPVMTVTTEFERLFNPHLFEIELLIFLDNFKKFITNLIGYKIHHLSVSDDRDETFFVEVELLPDEKTERNS